MGSIEVGRFSDLLRRMFSMVGQLEVAAELSPEISPTVELETAANQEWDFLKGVKQCSTSELIDANAGAGGQFRLRNPLGSGVLATTHELTMTGGVAGQRWAIHVGPQTGDLVNTSLTTARDGRWRQPGALQASVLIASFQNAVGTVPTGVGTVARWSTVANVSESYFEQIMLAPGDGVTFGSLTANQAVRITASWHERAVQPLEL